MPKSNNRHVPDFDLDASSYRNSDTPDLVHRLAEEMRVKSGIDLPHAYFVEQVKLKLAAEDGEETLRPGPVHHQSSGPERHGPTSSSTFQSWAMRDT